ncbi:MAG TPA: adenine nucleotide alpha hydrolase family protein, partial [Thermoprotei archaeon]|nr:adenine nucleotide alpha hydrolase family protein [Thermoprotei archaeon]
MMMCKFCRKPASIYIRYANIALCREHFIQFFERRIKRTIERFKMILPGEKIGVAVSGGKDSLALLYVLHSLQKDMDFNIIGYTIDLGINNYSKKCVEKSVKAYRNLGLKYRIIDLSEYGYTIDDVARYRISRRICGICGSVKRYILNKIAREDDVDRLATGHNLDDFLQVILQGYIHGDLIYLSKYFPITPSKRKLVSRIKPLVFTPEEEVEKYVIFRGIDYCREKCPYSFQASSHTLKKAILLIEENHPGIRFSMFNTYIKKIYPLIEIKYREEIGLNECKIC